MVEVTLWVFRNSLKKMTALTSFHCNTHHWKLITMLSEAPDTGRLEVRLSSQASDALLSPMGVHLGWAFSDYSMSAVRLHQHEAHPQEKLG
jgi:hypothetical protein